MFDRYHYLYTSRGIIPEIGVELIWTEQPYLIPEDDSVYLTNRTNFSVTYVGRDFQGCYFQYHRYDIITMAVEAYDYDEAIRYCKKFAVKNNREIVFYKYKEWDIRKNNSTKPTFLVRCC